MAQAEVLENKFGKMAGWNQVTINIFGRDVVGILEIKYDDETEIEGMKGAGKYDVGYGEGPYNANVSLKVYPEEANSIMDSIPPGKRISDAAPIPVPVEYTYQDRIRTDIINTFIIKGWGKEVKQGDKVVGMELKCYCSSITWNKSV